MDKNKKIFFSTLVAAIVCGGVLLYWLFSYLHSTNINQSVVDDVINTSSVNDLYLSDILEEKRLKEDKRFKLAYLKNDRLYVVDSENNTSEVAEIDTAIRIERIIGWLDSAGDWLVVKAQKRANNIYYLIRSSTGPRGSKEINLNQLLGVEFIEVVSVKYPNRILFGYRKNNKDIERGTDIYQANLKVDFDRVELEDINKIYFSPLNNNIYIDEWVIGKESPDGQYLAFDLGGSPLNPYGLIKIIRAKTGQIEKNISGSSVQWLKDGQFLFYGLDSGSKKGIYFLDKNLKKFIRVINNSAFNVAISSDENLLAYSIFIGDQKENNEIINEAIFISDLSGENIKEIYKSRWGLRDLSFSPDGDFLTFREYDQGEPKSFLFNRDTNQLIDVGEKYSFCWFVFDN
ncbi:MAG: hypothetical protein WC480_00500 [Patescibacteria group bacterium]